MTRTTKINQPAFVGFTTPQIGFAIDTQLWRTTDGGLTWKVVTF